MNPALKTLPFSWAPVGTGLTLIAGPCSAETEQQVLTTALAVQQLGIKMFRVGIWKPRTRPHGFEGIGVPALAWLQQVRAQTGMRLAVEVASAQHVEAALQAEIDLLWIGARSTANPFTVQEVADALRGSQVPVLVKNPTSPDLGLWLGALERLGAAGLTQLAACHRGFAVHGKSIYRNAPEWELPLELRRLRPELPLLCDPSHIAGQAAHVQEVAQRALDFGFDGLMIESHIDPSHAWSDASQQLTPAALGQLLDGLIIRTTDSADARYQAALAELRALVAAADQTLLEAVAQRMSIVQRIIALKEAHGVQPYHHTQAAQVMADRIAIAQRLGISEAFVAQALKLLHLEGVQHRKQTIEPA